MKLKYLCQPNALKAEDYHELMNCIWDMIGEWECFSLQVCIGSWVWQRWQKSDGEGSSGDKWGSHSSTPPPLPQETNIGQDTQQPTRGLWSYLRSWWGMFCSLLKPRAWFLFCISHFIALDIGSSALFCNHGNTKSSMHFQHSKYRNFPFVCSFLSVFLLFMIVFWEFIFELD